MNWAYSYDLRNMTTAASVALLRIQQVSHKQQLSGRHPGTAYEQGMDHSGIFHWASHCGSPAAMEWQSCWQPSTDTEQTLLRVTFLSQWPALLAWCLSQHKAVSVIRESMTNTLPWSQAVQSYSPPKFFSHWEKWYYVRPMLCIMQLCHFWLGRQSPVSGSRVTWNSG